MMRYLSEEERMHPLRMELSEDDMGDIAAGIAADEDWMSLDEIEAVQDALFDAIAAKKQTVPGSICLQ
jgi:cytochrome c553